MLRMILQWVSAPCLSLVLLAAAAQRRLARSPRVGTAWRLQRQLRPGVREAMSPLIEVSTAHAHQASACVTSRATAASELTRTRGTASCHLLGSAPSAARHQTTTVRAAWMTSEALALTRRIQSTATVLPLSAHAIGRANVDRHLAAAALDAAHAVR